MARQFCYLSYTKLHSNYAYQKADSDSDDDDDGGHDGGVEVAAGNRPGFKSCVRTRNDTLVCTTCGCKADRDYCGACNILETGLHQGRRGAQTSRPYHLEYSTHLPVADAAWKRAACEQAWQRHRNLNVQSCMYKQRAAAAVQAQQQQQVQQQQQQVQHS